MSLELWKQNGWLREYKTSLEEVASILALVDRDLADAAREREERHFSLSLALDRRLNKQPYLWAKELKMRVVC
jgi:hypothetical protein